MDVLDESQPNAKLALPKDKQKTLTFNNITYAVKEKKNKVWTEKVILNQVSGYAKPGQILAIMGPSGSGKTTLLDCLSNRISASKLQGEILIDGATHDKMFKSYASYVQQEDALMGSLSVKECMSYSASLNLPTSVPSQEKEELVSTLLEELGLDVCKETKIGIPFISKGVSGGQKRRVSIAMELVSNPSVLLLDEPTTGLDSASSFYVMEKIKNIARQGRTVICTIHQPSSELFGFFDSLMLLSRGQVVYFGPGSQALPYFASIGHPAPQYVNPADFCLNLINTDFNLKADIGQFVTQYASSDCAKEQRTELDRLLGEGKQSKAQVQVVDNTSEFCTGLLWQLGVLCKRNFINNIRNPFQYWMRVAIYGALGLVMGSLYFDAGYAESAIQDRMSAQFFTLAFLNFVAVVAFPGFLEERAVFLKERQNGYYRISAYATANAVCQVPWIMIFAILYGCIIYFMIGFNTTYSDNFIYFLVMIFCQFWTSENMVTALSAIVPAFIVGLALATCMFGLFMLVCGFFVLKPNIPVYWYWSHWCSYFSYGMSGMLYNEFEGTVFYGPDNTPIYGEQLLIKYDILNTDKWGNVGAVIGFAMLFRVSFYLLLRFVNRGKR